jgi:serine/threonine-protein phosphatase 2A regulatory subunit A
VNAVISVELLNQSLLPAIVDLAEDGKWRVRLAIIEHIPMLAKQLGKDYFGEKLNSLCMAWLGDDVYTVRRAATENLQKLLEYFGEDWASEVILPHIDRMRSHNNYLHRTTALYGIQALVRCSSVSLIDKKIVPLVALMSADPVPNVRFIAAKTLELISSRRRQISANSLGSKEAEGLLAKLSTDSDRDVKFYANQVNALN